MPPASADDEATICPNAKCGYKIRNKDKMFVTDHKVWHVICYNCGMEFIE